MFQLGSPLEFIQAFPFLLSLLFLGLIFYLTSVMNTAEPRHAVLAVADCWLRLPGCSKKIWREIMLYVTNICDRANMMGGGEVLGANTAGWWGGAKHCQVDQRPALNINTASCSRAQTGDSGGGE